MAKKTSSIILISMGKDLMFQKFFSVSSPLILSLLVFCFAGMGHAQTLEYLPPIAGTHIKQDTGTFFILATGDFARNNRATEDRPYVNSIQIFDGSNSWPPCWYASTPVYTDEMFARDTVLHRMSFNLNCWPLIDSNYLSFCNVAPKTDLDTSVPGEFQMQLSYLILNNTMTVIDTINTRFIYGQKYGPDYRTNPKLEKIIGKNITAKVDISKLTGDPNDKAVECMTGILQVIDYKNKVKFSWNPLEHLNAKAFPDKEGIKQVILSNGGGWDYDGNLLYALQSIGIGKVSKQDGHVLWHIHYTDMPIVSGHDTILWHDMSDFKLRSSNDTAATYSLYDKGSVAYPHPRGVIFELDKKTSKIAHVRYFHQRSKYQESNEGSFNYDSQNGYYTFSYGLFENSDADTPAIRPAFEYGRRDSAYAVYMLPKWNYVMGVHRIENWPIPPRPVIIRQGDQLRASGTGSSQVWYKLNGKNNTVATKVGTGQSIKPEVGAVYCLETPYGMGFSVSKAFDTKKQNQ